MSKRKTGALRKEQMKQQHKNPFYTAETIDFNREYKKQRKPIELLPQSVNQEKYILSLIDRDLDIVVVSGPAGTGKTYLAMLAAIKSLRNGDCDKIILTRPAVAVDDFVPGDRVQPAHDILDRFGYTGRPNRLKEHILKKILSLLQTPGSGADETEQRAPFVSVHLLQALH